MTESRKCRECGRPLRKVAPRNIIEITEDHNPKIAGAYCCSDCALDAWCLGEPPPKENTK